MDSYLAYLSFGFIKKFDHFCDPYFIKAPLSTVCFSTVFNVFYDNKNGSFLSLWKHYIQ